MTKPLEGDELADALGAAVVAGRVRVLAVGKPSSRAVLVFSADGVVPTYARLDADPVAGRAVLGLLASPVADGAG